MLTVQSSEQDSLTGRDERKSNANKEIFVTRFVRINLTVGHSETIRKITLIHNLNGKNLCTGQILQEMDRCLPNDSY